MHYLNELTGQITEMFSRLTFAEQQPAQPDYTTEIAAGVTIVALAVSCCCVSQRMFNRRQGNNANYAAALTHAAQASTGANVELAPAATSSTTSKPQTQAFTTTATFTTQTTSSAPQKNTEHSALTRRCFALGLSLSSVQLGVLQSDTQFANAVLGFSDELNASILHVCKLARATHQGDELSLLKYAMDVCNALKGLLGALPTEDQLNQILSIKAEMSEQQFIEKLQDGKTQIANDIKRIVKPKVQLDAAAQAEQARLRETHERAEQAKADQALAEQRAVQARARADQARAREKQARAEAQARAEREAQARAEREAQARAEREAKARVAEPATTRAQLNNQLNNLLGAKAPGGSTASSSMTDFARQQQSLVMSQKAGQTVQAQSNLGTVATNAKAATLRNTSQKPSI